VKVRSTSNQKLSTSQLHKRHWQTPRKHWYIRQVTYCHTGVVGNMYSGLYTSLVCISERHIAYVFLFAKGIWACRLQYNPLKSCMVLKVPKGRRITNFIPWYRGIFWNSRFTIPHMAICKYITWPRTTDYMMRRIYTNN
jgi:hypothetical protein